MGGYGCEEALAHSVETIDEFKEAISYLNSLHKKVDAWVLMFHGHPNFLNLEKVIYDEDGRKETKLEYLSANGEFKTPKGGKAYPIDLLPNIEFRSGGDSYIQVNTCRGGFPDPEGLNVGQAFYQRYRVKTIAYPY